MRNIKEEVMEACEMNDTKALRKLIALRKRDKDDLAAEEAILEIYKAALGMV